MSQRIIRVSENGRLQYATIELTNSGAGGGGGPGNGGAGGGWGSNYSGLGGSQIDEHVRYVPNGPPLTEEEMQSGIVNERSIIHNWKVRVEELGWEWPLLGAMAITLIIYKLCQKK